MGLQVRVKGRECCLLAKGILGGGREGGQRRGMQCMLGGGSLFRVASFHYASGPLFCSPASSTKLMAASRKLRVAVIGAGAAGLCAARHILAFPTTFAPPVVFEASNHLGGTWHYTDATEDAEGCPVHSSMYRDLR